MPTISVSACYARSMSCSLPFHLCCPCRSGLPLLQQVLMSVYQTHLINNFDQLTRNYWKRYKFLDWTTNPIRSVRLSSQLWTLSLLHIAQLLRTTRTLSRHEHTFCDLTEADRGRPLTAHGTRPWQIPCTSLSDGFISILVAHRCLYIGRLEGPATREYNVNFLVRWINK